MNDYEVGSVATVTIVGLATYGAFARVMQGIDGLIHISQISYDHVANTADVLKIGDEVKVKITAIDFEKKRVSLSIKETLEPPVVKETTTENELVAEATPEEVIVNKEIEETVE